MKIVITKHNISKQLSYVHLMRKLILPKNSAYKSLAYYLHKHNETSIFTNLDYGEDKS
jgi:hypothetical protein